MATIIATTRSIQFLQSGVTTYTVTLSQATTAGSKLVMVGFGGAIITGRITDASGTLFSKRTEALSDESLSIQDYDCVGGETQVHVTLNGPENTAVYIYEVSGLGSFIAASNNGGGSAINSSGNYGVSPSSAINIPSGKAVIFAGWSVATTTAFSETNKWRQMGPLGKLWDTFAVQPGNYTQFIAATGVADVTSTGRFPMHLSAGNYQATSVYINPSSLSWSSQAAYEDLSSVATNPAPANDIVAENSLPGQHNSNWFIGSNGTNSTIAGYTDKCSYAPGDTVNFKVDSSGNPFRVEIYRLGHYGWESFGARSVLGTSTITGTIVSQPSPTVDGTLGSTKCNWTTNASWTIPSDAASGIYYVTFRRTDATSNFATSHFVVNSSSVTGKVAFCIPDMTYQAYNLWGATTDQGTLAGGTWSGRNVYGSGADAASPNAGHRAYAVSFDRPYGTQSTQPSTYLFDSEYGMLHFMEAQGYDIAYLSNLDLDANSTILNGAQLVLLSGHQEYWTKGVYDCLTNAVDAGVNMLSSSSNTALWRTRFDASDSGRRTMICYKDSLTADVSPGWAGSGYDPILYTGTWRDSRNIIGGVANTDIRRENALMGQMFTVNAPVNVPILVSFSEKSKPIWRNSAGIQALTSGQQFTASGVFGDEVDVPDGSAGQPTNMVLLCATPITASAQGANAAGTVYTLPVSTTASFTIYRRASGALVFNTGSWRGWQGVCRWARSTLGSPVSATSLDWQNAFLSILYDLGVTPTTLRALQPGIDTSPTDPSVSAPTGTRDDIAVSYGLTLDTPPPDTPDAARNGDFFLFFV